jgi:L-alanine-DL-glutamate epimerase-like enolase superfamily enzyme
MKIESIRAVGLRGGTPEGGWSNELRPEDCVQTLVFVRTADGLVGYGSAFTNDGLVRSALTVLEPLYRAENALEPERVSEKLRQHTFWQGRGGSITHAISGIDIALWDILGKATGQPVGRLLGGRYRNRVRPYASLLMDQPGPLCDALERVMDSGFTAVKMGWGPFGRVSQELDEEIVRRARETVGPDVLLMVDAGGSDAFWPGDFKWALRTSRMLDAYDIRWFEEPLPPDSIEGYAELRRTTFVPIAGGEVLTRRQAFRSWLQAGALDVVQPDVTKVGGISESRRIAWLAEENGVRFIPHGWNTAVGLAADLQLASALSRTDLVEYIDGSPYVDEIAAGGWSLDASGMISIPAAPGLGLELDLDAVARFSGEDLSDYLVD